MHCVYLKYPEREERAWNEIVTRISRSLRSSRESGQRDAEVEEDELPASHSITSARVAS